jgi:hypothetical protein
MRWLGTLLVGVLATVVCVECGPRQPPIEVVPATDCVVAPSRDPRVVTEAAKLELHVARPSPDDPMALPKALGALNEAYSLIGERYLACSLFVQALACRASKGGSNDATIARRIEELCPGAVDVPTPDAGVAAHVDGGVVPASNVGGGTPVTNRCPGCLYWDGQKCVDAPCSEPCATREEGSCSCVVRACPACQRRDVNNCGQCVRVHQVTNCGELRACLSHSNGPACMGMAHAAQQSGCWSGPPDC